MGCMIHNCCGWRKRLVCVSVLLLLLMLGSVSAQVDPITADPGAKRLNPVWWIEGDRVIGGDRIGDGIGGIGDVFGTGKGAWAVHFGKLDEWRVYRAYDDSLGTVPVWSLANSGPAPPYPVLGDFWGSGRKAVGFASGSSEVVDRRTRYYYELHIFRTDSNRLDSAATVVLNTRLMTPPTQIFPEDVLAVDLDGDGADELIIPLGGAIRGTTLSTQGEIWIYRGGANFQVDTPTVILTDPEILVGPSKLAASGDFDGDGRMDLAMAEYYGTSETIKRLYLFWGTDRLEDFGRPEHRRIIELGPGYPDADYGITALDCDGDGITDLVMDRTWNTSEPAVYLFRSRTGKDARTRSYQMSDADGVFPGYRNHRSGGYLNDSTKRYAMLIVIANGFTPGDPSRMLAFSGGEHGPDHRYDAYNNYAFTHSYPAGDIDGDGWGDYIGGSYQYGTVNSGIAMLFFGGPYIPRDPTMGVEVVAGEGHAQAISVWPNPAREELHVAWRGDLRRSPRIFHVHDGGGRLVASGEVDASSGGALWRCGGAAAGVYIVSIQDAQGSLLASVTVTKL